MVVGDPHMLSLMQVDEYHEEEVPLWQRPGWELFDMQGLPGPEIAVRDYGSVPPMQWKAPTARGEGDGIGVLSAADRAFWEANAYSTEELQAMSDWYLTNVSDAVGVIEEEQPPPQLKDLFAGVSLPGASAGMDLNAEIEAMQTLLKEAKIIGDPVNGFAPLSQQTAAIEHALTVANDGEPPPPLPADWQEEPTKAEWKALAKIYAQRRRGGESAEDLAVLGEALKCCGVKAARQLVADVEKEAAEK